MLCREARGSPCTGAQLELSVNGCLYSNTNLSTLLCKKKKKVKQRNFTGQWDFFVSSSADVPGCN